MKEKWRDYARELQQVLGLRGKPVSVTYTAERVAGASGDKVAACDALVRVREGASLLLDKDTLDCQGGKWHLGLAPEPQGEARQRLNKFLVQGEKLFCSPAVFHRTSLGTPPPLGLTPYVYMAPLAQSPLRPDVVVFFVNPEQACRLMTLATWSTGVSPRCLFVGSTCRMAITYPLLSGEINVVLGDWTTRKRPGYEAGELLVSVPYHHLHGIIEAIPECTAGTAPFVAMHDLP